MCTSESLPNEMKYNDLLVKKLSAGKLAQYFGLCMTIYVTLYILLQ